MFSVLCLVSGGVGCDFWFFDFMFGFFCCSLVVVSEKDLEERGRWDIREGRVCGRGGFAI